MEKYKIFILLLSMSLFSCKANVDEPTAFDVKNKPTRYLMSKTDTIRTYYYNNSEKKYSKEFSQLVLIQDEDQNFHSITDYGEVEILINGNGKMEKLETSFNQKYNRKILVTYDSENLVKEIRNYESKKDTFLLLSIEKYNYEDKLLKNLDYVTYMKPGNYLDSVVVKMEHKYVNDDRLQQTINSRKRKYDFETLDTVNYFYAESSNLPFKVQKSMFGGVEYLISWKSKNELEFKKILKEVPSENAATITTSELYKFDNENRIIQYTKTISDDLLNSKNSYERYTMTYSDEVNLKNIPIQLFMRGLPDSDVMSYFTSNLETDHFRDIKILTTTKYSQLPKLIEYSISLDGINWIPGYKHETN